MHRQIRIDLCKFDEPVWIDNPQSPIVKLQQAFFLQVIHHPVDAVAGQTCVVTNTFLRLGKSASLPVPDPAIGRASEQIAGRSNVRRAFVQTAGLRW